MRVRWTNVVTLLALPACLPAIAPWIGGWHWTIDLAASFAVQAMWWLTLAATLLLVGRKWRRAAGAALFAASATLAILPGFCVAHSFPEDVENPQRLTVMTLNLLRSNEQGHSQALRVVRTEQPDVLFCGEYTPLWHEALSPALTEYPFRFEHPDPGYFGGAVFSRWPLHDTELLPMAHSWTPAIRTTIASPSGPIGLLGLHTPPPGLARWRVEDRDTALAAIPGLLAGMPAQRIVLGDFNTTPWNHPFGQLLTDADLDAGSSSDWLPSWPAQVPLPFRIPIDHVLTGGALRVERAWLGEGFGSDHFPLIAVIRAR